MEPKVRLQGYCYSPLCFHSFCCLETLSWQYFGEAFGAPRVRLKCPWKSFWRVFPLIALIALGAFFHGTPGSAQLFDIFRAGQKTSKIVKKRQIFSDTFRQFSGGTRFPARFEGLWLIRGNTTRGNRPERFWEGNLRLRGSLRGRVFRGFGRFSEVFRDFSEIFPLRVAGRVAPNRIAP